MIDRKVSNRLRHLAQSFKVVAVIGPRQSGKTTLVKAVFPHLPYISLENPDVRRFALEDPRDFLSTYNQGAVFDEAQRVTELFSYLQHIVDESPTTGRFILTGSHNVLPQQSISQSLAGRVAYQELMPFDFSEIGMNEASDCDAAMLKGGYPPLFDQPVTVEDWFSKCIRTDIERDVRPNTWHYRPDQIRPLRAPVRRPHRPTPERLRSRLRSGYRQQNCRGLGCCAGSEFHRIQTTASPPQFQQAAREDVKALFRGHRIRLTSLRYSDFRKDALVSFSRCAFRKPNRN